MMSDGVRAAGSIETDNLPSSVLQSTWFMSGTTWDYVWQAAPQKTTITMGLRWGSSAYHR